MIAVTEIPHHGFLQCAQFPLPLRHLTDIGTTHSAHTQCYCRSQAGTDDHRQVIFTTDIKTDIQPEQGQRTVKSIDHEVTPGNLSATGYVQ